MISKNWRIKFFNWLGAGRLTITEDKPQEYQPLSYSIGSGAYGNLSYNNTLLNQPDLSHMNITASSLNFNVAKASGGWIVQVNTVDCNAITLGGIGPKSDLYIISEDADFDSALGKIVTLSCLKAE